MSTGELVPVGANVATRIGGSYATAVRVALPRVIANVEKRLLEEAAIAGTTFYYGWGTHKDRVEGPSVGLAMAAVRTWGNCVVDMLPVQETSDAWIFAAAFVDLETGFTLTRQFRQAKDWSIHGRFDDARKDDMRFQIGQSKAIRNVVLCALPAWLIDRVMDKAKDGVRQALEKLVGEIGMDKVREAAVRKMGEVGVPAARVLSRFQRTAIAALTLEDLVLMKGDLEALRSGAERPESLYPLAEADAPTTTAGALLAPRGNAETTSAGAPTDEADAETLAEFTRNLAACGSARAIEALKAATLSRLASPAARQQTEQQAQERAAALLAARTYEARIERATTPTELGMLRDEVERDGTLPESRYVELCVVIADRTAALTKDPPAPRAAGGSLLPEDGSGSYAGG